MPEYHIGNVGRGEVPTVTDEGQTTGTWFDLNHRMRQDLIDARMWAAVWKAESKSLREDYLALEDSFLQDHAHLEAVIKELEAAKVELDLLNLQIAGYKDERLAREMRVEGLKAELAELAELKARRCTGCKHSTEGYEGYAHCWRHATAFRTSFSCAYWEAK